MARRRETRPAVDRRTLLRGLGGALGVLGTSGVWGLRTAAARRACTVACTGAEDFVDPESRALLLLQLTGGNDGLSTVVPHGDDAYHAARQATRFTAEELHAIDDYRGLHPELVRLHRRYQEGGLAIVEGVGYPRPNRSHFKSLDIWHTASAEGRALDEGWIGRLCRARFGTAAEANRVVHIGRAVPYSLTSELHPPAAFATPAGYRWMRRGDDLLTAEPERPSGNAALDLLRERVRDAHDSSGQVRAVVADYRTPVAYPDDELGRSLRVAAALVNGAIGTRVVSVTLGSFDTHVDQPNRHASLLASLDAGLGALLEDLERTPVGRLAVVMGFSEFGRRVAENGSRGTDHGTAGPMFVAGARVRGGLYGEHPSLTELDEGDLVHTVDFRSVYATVLEACFDVRAADVLGRAYPKLALFG